MRIRAFLFAALLAALAGLPAPSFAGALGPVVIRGLGPDDFTPRAFARFRPIRPVDPARRWREPEPTYVRAAFVEPRRFHAPTEQASLWPQPSSHPYESNPYDRSYRPGAYTAADPIPSKPAPVYGYYLDEGPFPVAR
ncbi:hypothetical protein [Methylosinus sp. Ce-a6]|uniref:hypothetical protein n=1 Tax=Methylosinus sp. Ce-a6 TaxID=2172005 RepID=UPI00135A481D|nr:hypothetical protein [Methylosinus sp. Ce-a6]